MYKLEDYIIAARAIQVIETAYETNMMIKYTNGSQTISNQKNLLYTGLSGIDSIEFYVEIQQILENLFEFLFPGATLDRYISARKYHQKAQYPHLNQIPIFILNIPEYDLKLPLYISQEYVYFVSPFGNNELKAYSMNYYIYPLFRTSILMNAKSYQAQYSSKNLGASILKSDLPLVYTYKKGVDLFGDTLKATLLDICGFPIKRQIELISNLSDGRSYYDQEIISTESTIYQDMLNRYNVEAVSDSEYDTLITPTDYLPIVVKTNIENHYAFLTTTSANNSSIIQDIEIKPIKSSSQAQMTHSDTSKVLLRTSIDRRQICYLTDGVYMIPHNRLAIYQNDILFGTISIDTYYDNAEAIDPTPGTEGLMSDMFTSLKIGGIKITQSFKELIKLLMKFPIKIAKYIFKDIKNFFRKFDKELEKSDSLDYREKVLNDELDQTTDLLAKWSRVIVFSTLTLAIFGHVLFLFFGLIFWKIDDENSRVRSINRQIKSFNDAIERLDQKIGFARQESRYEDVDALMKEKQMLELGKRELLQLKKRNYAKADERNKEKYGDYDNPTNHTLD